MKRQLPAWAIVLLLLVGIAGLVWTTSEAFATPATELATSAGITVEQAERDITAQEGAPGIVERLEGALGASYAGVWFNNKTGRFIVPLSPGAPKASVKAAMGQAPSAFPGVARTYAQLEAKRDELAAPSLAVYIDPKANAVRVLFASSMSAAQKSSIKAKAEPGVIVQSVKPSELATFPVSSCAFPFCMEPEGMPTAYQHGVVRGGVEILFGYSGYCTAGFIVTDYETDYMLSAGHCGWYLATWEPPLNVYQPQYAHPSPCQMHNVVYYTDEAHGDMGLASLDGCEYSRTLEAWHSHSYEPPEQLAVWTKAKTIFNCPADKPYCNERIPADARGYIGQWVCHSGATTRTECGEVRRLDMTITAEYPEHRIIPEHHLEFVCAYVEGGDSGGPMFARSGNHAIAQGIVTRASRPGCGVYAEEMWWIKQALGVHLP